MLSFIVNFLFPNFFIHNHVSVHCRARRQRRWGIKLGVNHFNLNFILTYNIYCKKANVLSLILFLVLNTSF